MKCVEIEKLVYLYDISDDREQKLVDHHVNTCDSCRKLMDQQQQNQQLLKALGRPTLTLDEAAFANRVMVSLPRRSSGTVKGFFLEDFFNSLWMRYSFAIASAILIGVFFFEYNYETNSGSPTVRTIPVKVITLNSQEFIRNRKERAPAYSLVACISPCKEETAPGLCKECPSFILNK